MIKVGIIGASTAGAGEVIRILVNHPDVVIRAAYDPEKTGHAVSSVHHGLIGECDLNFTEQLDPAKLDCLILCAPSPVGDYVLTHPEETKDLCVIDMTGEHRGDYADLGMVYGLSEINRKPLVRGAKRAVVPSPVASAALVALYPFALHLMLGSAIDITAAGINSESSSPEELAGVISSVQSSFSSPIEISPRESGSQRGLRVCMEFDCTLSVSDALKLYEELYDDHNFSFATSEPLDIREVEGTHKCLVSVSKTESGRMHLESIVDATLRGGAGEAVHLLNLLFGLHERTGLNLKASNF